LAKNSFSFDAEHNLEAGRFLALPFSFILIEMFNLQSSHDLFILGGCDEKRFP